MAKRKVIVVAVVLALAGCAVLGVTRLSQRGDCRSPLFVRAFAGPDASSVAALIARAGGLACLAVGRWSLVVGERRKRMGIHQQPTTSDQQPDSQLRWSTWRYGLVLCPLVVGYADGPPGRLDPVEPGGG